ncbi:MAG: xanthine dehydrogenase family protein molybdopterin-binding subunit [Actinobacteria bacterium]|nr:xanthine dehydrogenase family protein molybdopterin-binding subunit [Actinomycetota bacterium]
MAGSILGNRVLRKEDPKFLTTGGVYVDDMRDEAVLAGAAHVTFVRSPLAHAHIRDIDVSDALQAPGVLAVHTAASLNLQPEASSYNPGCARTLLASDRVRYVGEPIAVVVTERADQGEDAADRVIVDYEPIEALVDLEAAMESTTLIYPAAGSNVMVDSTLWGMPGVTGDEFFADCEVVVKGRYMNQRLAPCPLEVRGSAVAWVDGRLYQWISTQHAQGVRDQINKSDPSSSVRVITPDVGGGFGAKISAYPEEIVLGRLAQAVGRPLRWRETRSESMLALGHGRAQLQYVTIGGTRDGKVLAYRLEAIQDCGAFVDVGAVLAPACTRPMSSGVYAIPKIECRTKSVVTNTTPIVAYRGAGRPEATAAIERAIDMFAAEIGKDAAEVRRMNLIAKFNEPHTTAIGQAYDVGDYEAALNKVLAAANYDDLRREQAERRKRNDRNQLGIGVSVYVEITSGGTNHEDARIEVLPDGRAIVYTGTSPHGQGHVTAWSMIASEHTGISMDKIDVVWGDTDIIPEGLGTYGSRSLQLGGAAVHQTAEKLVELARSIAASALEAAEADVVLDKDRGAFHVVGTPARAVTWGELATRRKADGGLAVAERFTSGGATFPFGAHVAVVEVDTETGKVTHLRQIACDDAGTVLNPLLLEGQIHGGIAQGSAQALLEEFVYDDDGNPKTGNLAEYAFISAVETPRITLVPMATPTPRNPLGAKGVGESGTIGSTPAVQSAVVDAVSHLGVRHIDMPTTPERVWRAMNRQD